MPKHLDRAIADAILEREPSARTEHADTQLELLMLDEGVDRSWIEWVFGRRDRDAGDRTTLRRLP